METIFVSVACYRDPECSATIKDLFLRASRPERVFVGVCWQFISPDDDAHFEPRTRPDQVRVAAYDARQSLGACWAKSEAEKLWQGEDYVLSIDSHMRFADGWDERMIAMLRDCPSPRPVLSTYPAPYYPPDTREPCILVMKANKILDHGPLELMPDHAILSEPKRSPYVAGGFVFARAQFSREVPCDPDMYFLGEETSGSVRAFTWGWDVFAPHECLIYHYYVRQEASRHWTDNKDWGVLDQKSRERLKTILGLGGNEQIDPQFGLGRARTLQEYEEFAGLNFTTRRILC